MRAGRGDVMPAIESKRLIQQCPNNNIDNTLEAVYPPVPPPIGSSPGYILPFSSDWLPSRVYPPVPPPIGSPWGEEGLLQGRAPHRRAC
eukprot:9491475-Pyramimonas_sp.AAC.1